MFLQIITCMISWDTFSYSEKFFSCMNSLTYSICCIYNQGFPTFLTFTVFPYYDSLSNNKIWNLRKFSMFVSFKEFLSSVSCLMFIEFCLELDFPPSLHSFDLQYKFLDVIQIKLFFKIFPYSL